MKKSRCLIVFAREPQIGRVKTRFHNHLTPAQTLKLYTAFVHDVLRQTHQLSVEARHLYYTGRQHPDFLSQFSDFTLVQQRGVSLGERMHRSFVRSWREGHTATVLVGTDCLSLTPALYRAAYAALNKFDVVLGPSHDGGYYLIGLKHPQPALLTDIHWGTDTVLTQTLDRIKKVGLCVRLLAPQPDMDDWPTLQAFMRQPSPRRYAPHTAAAYRNLR